MPNKRVTVHYRRAVSREFQDLDFRACFEGGLAGQVGGEFLHASDRARLTTSSDGRRMCLLTPHSDANICFGEVAVFRDGDVPVAQTTDAGQINLGVIPLGDDEEAVRGTTYFMARGPHLAILHHESSTRFLQEYLGWLFRNPIGVLPQDELVSLVPLINVGGQMVALHNVKSLKMRAEVQGHPMAMADGVQVEHERSFRRMIDRQQLSLANVRGLLGALGLTAGNLDGEDIRDLEFELIVRKKEGRRLAALPDNLVQSVMDDGLDRAAEFQTQGARRRGDAAVASYPGDVQVDDAYYNLPSVRALLWAALQSWADQGLI